MLLCRDAVYSLINLNESTIATGDDQGCVKVAFFYYYYFLKKFPRFSSAFVGENPGFPRKYFSLLQVWDTRQRSCCNSFNAHEDYVSDMTFESDSMKLLGTRYVQYYN